MLFAKDKQKSFPSEIIILKTLTALGQNHEAVEFAKDLLKKSIHKDVILFYQGLALENEGNMQQATEQYEKAIKMNPNLAQAIVRLGQIYLQRTDAANARKYLLKAVKIIKNNPGIFHSLGLVAHFEGDNKKAIKYWKKAIRLDKRYTPAIENLKMYNIHIQKSVDIEKSIRESEILEQRRQVEEKIKYLEVLENPQNAPYEFYLGRKGFIYLHRENYKSFTYLEGDYNYQVISKPTVKKMMQIILSLIVHVSNLEIENIFWEISYGRGQYFIYQREFEKDHPDQEYTEGRYQKRKTPDFFKFRINSQQKLDDQQLNGNILLLKVDDKYYIIDNLGTDISYKLVNSLSGKDQLGILR